MGRVGSSRKTYNYRGSILEGEIAMTLNSWKQHEMKSFLKILEAIDEENV